MSCDGNRHKYFEQLAQRQDIQQALELNAEQCAQMLERLYQIGQSVGTLKSGTGVDEVELALETEMTRKLFNRMRSLGIKPPTHSADGLPRKGSRWGYGQIERLLDAVENGKSLPPVAVSMAEKTRQGLYKMPPATDPKGYLNRMGFSDGALSSVGFDHHGYYRCANCGQFASQTKGHVCPMTATSQDLGQMLERRLGVPASAFQGYKVDALQQLLENARRGPINMIHALTGRVEKVTLDGIPQAMMAGFIPEEWKDHAVPVLSENQVNVIGVLNADGLIRAAENMSAVQQIAAAYGLNLAPNVPVMNAYQVVQQASPLNIVETGDGQLELKGGQEYDLGHFIGTEFRKNDARGTFVEIGGKRYAVYARSQNPADKSSARGVFATDTPDIVLGRTLPAAIGILEKGGVAETNGKVEVYDENGSLLAVYDPATHTAGDTQGNTNASAEQMAAILAYHMLHPQTVFDYALIRDFSGFRHGQGSPIAAADSGYLALRNQLESGQILHLGGQIAGVRRCPRCGRFVGRTEHNCPTQVVAEEAKETVPGNEPVESIPLDRSLSPTQVAPVQVTVTLPDRFAEDLGKIVADLLNARPSEAQPPVSNDLESTLNKLATLMSTQQEMLQKMMQQAVGGNVLLDEEKFAAALARNLPVANGSNMDVEKLGTAIASAVARNIPAPVMVVGENGNATPAVRVSRCPRCGQMMDENHQCPPRQERQGVQRPPDAPPNEVEKIVDGIVMAAPDLYLDNVPLEWGGQRAIPLPENVPEFKSDEEYEIGQQERTIYKMIALQLRKQSKRPTNRAFGLYGPAGTGKNTIARMLAASLKCDDGKQGLPYYEVNITPDMDIAQAIGEVVLTTDENGNTVSRVRLGPIGTVAASGGVVAVNEIVRSPKLATALQSMIEDGEISIPTPEGGTTKVPVHPSAIFVTTWNPGYEGDADRPAQAFLSRITAFPLNYPSKEEQIQRLRAHFTREGLEQPSQEILEATVGFWNDLRALTGEMGQPPQIGAFSPTRTTPGPREMARFVEYGLSAGWENALLTLEVICDQESEYRATQVSILRDRFDANFAGLV